MPLVVRGVIAPGDSLPVAADWSAISHGEEFADPSAESIGGVVPHLGRFAFDDSVRMSSQTYCTSG